jgi:uncharacterized protein with ParB-like and HNH nuclease domain
VNIKEKLTINPENTKCKIDYTGRRMKIYIKLNKTETDGWNNIKKGFEGFPGTEDELVKMMFFRGVNAFMDDLKSQVAELSEDEKAEIMAEVEAGKAESESKVSEKEASDETDS